MKYRVEVDVAFHEESDAVAFLNLLQELKEKICTTDDSPIPVVAKARYHECFHDEANPKQCGGYIDFDLKWEEKEVIRTKAGVAVTSDSLMIKPIIVEEVK